MKYGVFIGRYQPFHLGHQAVVNEMLLDGLIPVLILGSSQDDRNRNKNPLTFVERVQLIELIYPNNEIRFIRNEDNNDWDQWYKQTIDSLAGPGKHFLEIQEECIFYYNEKEVDRTTFLFNGKTYEDTWYTDIFKDVGFQTQKIKLAERSDIKIHSNARDIRHDLEGYKHLLDARVYYQLKQWGWK